MPRVELDIATTLPPDAVVAALTDFSSERPAIWPGLAPSLYEVYEVGETSAFVREGSVMGPVRIWARERYDWSQPGLVTWQVEESNFCTPGSGVSAEVSPTDEGSTIHVRWHRSASTPLALPMLWMIQISKGKPLRASVEPALRALERGSRAGAAR